MASQFFTLPTTTLKQAFAENTNINAVTVYVVYLAVILIWWFGKFLLIRQI